MPINILNDPGITNLGMPSLGLGSSGGMVSPGGPNHGPGINSFNINDMSKGFDDWQANVAVGANDFWTNLQDWASGLPDRLKDMAQRFGEMQEHNVWALTGVGPNPDTPQNNDGFIDNPIEDALDTGASLSQYIQDHPGASGEDLLKYMASQSDEWSEKYVDYLLEKGSIEAQNDYTAGREDTAYQRLVKDLKTAGLNPALMYGSSASPSASGSTGVVKASEGANARTIGNYDKIKRLILAYMMYRLQGLNMTANMTTNFMGSILKMLI